MDIQNLFSLNGRVALVTGGGKGIGRMITEGFLASGAKVYISSRNAEDCHSVAEELGEQCIALPMDVSSVEGCRALADQLGEKESVLDILVHNAGVAWGAEFDEFPESGWDKVMDLNVKAPFFLTQALHSLLKAKASPDSPSKVINIASIDGIGVNAWETYSYHASKAGLIHLTRRIAAKLVKEHIYVSAIAPGAFASRMNRAARDRGGDVAKRIPCKRIGREEDMAAAAVYLASHAGDYVVGSTLVVDGGITMAGLHSIEAE